MRTNRTIPADIRFWSKVDQSGECWIWTGALHWRGYGLFGLRPGVLRRAHRISWELTNGPIPDGLWVLHKCDNRPCVRPSYLFLGTVQDNTDDRQRKSRQASGARCGSAKLSEEQVVAIRHARALGQSSNVLAAEYHVNRNTILNIGNRKTWRHIL